MPQLVIVDPKGAEQRVQLDRQEYFLGRDPTCHLQLPDKKVSRKHARLFLKAGTYWIEDLGSANGVLCGGRPVSGPLRLTPNMLLDIGGFKLSWEPEPTAPTAVGEETFSLVGRTPPFLNQRFMLPMGQLDVGRIEGNAIAIPDGSVSRKHARLEVTATAVSVEDLDSSNGTCVNGQKVGRCALSPGDRVRFGSVEFELLRAGQISRIGLVTRVWHRFLRFDRPIQIAIVIGGMTLVLLVTTLAVTVSRGARFGRSTAAQSPEEAYEQAIADALKSAREQMLRQAWTDAAQAFQRVLDKDPIDREARRGLAEAQASLRDQQVLAAARTALDAGQPLDALHRLQDIQPSSHYGSAAQELMARARVAAGDTALEMAKNACKRSEWKECHDHAVSLLEVQPDSVPGLTLINESENAMRARKIPFTPWASPAMSAGVASLDRVYPSPDLREAALRYSAGDFDAAVRRAQIARGPAAQQLLSVLAEFRRTKTAGDGAATTGDIDRALKAWEEALAADAKLLPTDHPSAPREELRHKLSLELYRKGDAAFGRANYSEAFQAWNAGLHFNPSNPDLLGGIAKLAERAQGLLAALPPGGTYTPEQCKRLQEVIAMTRGDSSAYQDASRRRHANCH